MSLEIPVGPRLVRQTQLIEQAQALLCEPQGGRCTPQEILVLLTEPEVAAFTEQVLHSLGFKLIDNLMKLKAIHDYSRCGLFLEDLLGKYIKGCGHFSSWSTKLKTLTSRVFLRGALGEVMEGEAAQFCFSTEHKHPKQDLNFKVAISLFTKYTVSQKQLRFIHINFIITQNHVNDVKCLAWPKPMGGAYFWGDIFPSPHFISHQPGAPRWAMPNLHKADCSCPAQSTQKPRCLDFLDTTHRDRPVKRTKRK